MAVERPTFHEAWYRIVRLRPRLLSSVQVYRQHFRGQMWYVLEDATTNKFSRLSSEAYRFIALLDGRRTVAQTWRICNEQLGDRAPTQGEVIQLLGQLYCSNLLQAELPPDAESLFNRYRTRIKRQVQGYLTNFLFVRIPLLDPDRFLDRWVGIFGHVFSWLGLVLWSVLITTGLYFVITNYNEFVVQSRDILDPDNLILLFASFWVIKIVHEFSHSFACKKFGRLNANAGQVHIMGIMLLVFVPLPYMDASSAWAFRRKWHRVIVGAAGMFAELSVAAIAAVIWANTSIGTTHIIAHNIIFIASVSTLIFNGNPLLRFDGYYILSDLLEIPNLSQRARTYLSYLVKRYCWSVKRSMNPANTLGECIWFVFYGIASTAYRVYICVRILLFLNERLPEQLFLVVPVLASAAVIMWVLVPLGKFLRFLATSPELARTRPRAVTSTLAGALVLLTAIALLPGPDYARVEGIVEPVHLTAVYTAGDGFVRDFLPSGSEVTPDGEPLIKSVNRGLETEQKVLLAQRRALEIQRSLARTSDAAAAQIMDEQISALDEKIKRVGKEMALLNLPSPASGTWVAPDIELLRGAYLARGQQIGFVASVNEVFIRATAGQTLAAILIEQAYDQVQVRMKDRPDLEFAGTIEEFLPAGQRVLPSAALGYAVGGSMPTLSQDPRETRAAERFFEIKIRPEADAAVVLLTGRRVVVRCRMPAKPLAAQWWRSLRQLFQRRFHI